MNHDNKYEMQQCQSAVKKEGKQKRIRTRFSTHQLIELEKEYAINCFLSRIKRAEVAKRIGLEDRKVKVWFQNRRSKSKKHPGVDCSPSYFRPSSLPSSSASPQSDSSSVPVPQDETELMTTACVVSEEPQVIQNGIERTSSNQGQSIILTQEQWRSSNQGSMFPWHHENITNTTSPYHMFQPQHNPQSMYHTQYQNYRPNYQQQQAPYQNASLGFAPYRNDMYSGNLGGNFAQNGDFNQMQPYIDQELPQPVIDWSPSANYSGECYGETFWDDLINSVEL